ncbi:Patatin-like serine hydrolase [Cordyceps fumosorosea ARSEF 2679]|uniref:Lysophospholipase NTE1 n=1 Tax=Cordyceps fumosorosea (strain ARSEF 2679) TaxID=1081104 RepID=A0A162LCY9_CORFA|nr:Patatin-like serine hydrolase [Cordyceps fumosorosea ARSEF 2679]OAA68834.1 Patatin-like serine hydrolase [Cordyceps fumosorosea ARSEF 2679]
MASDLSTAATLASSFTVDVPVMSTSAVEVTPKAGFGWFGILGWIILTAINLVSMALYWAIRIVTITIPSLLYTLLSASWTVTMNATTLIFIMVAIASAVSWVVRYRILNMYSRLPPEPQRKEPDIDLFPDTHEEGMKSGLSNYLDEFLSAIKIFGYLERPVFHELTRSMQTRKLIAGETINLEEEKGFCIVVDGLVEIFVKTGQDARNSGSSSADQSCHDSSEDEEYMARGQQKYHLLTEVRNGAPMSSLFSIMSLFTEDVKLRLADEEEPQPEEGADSGPFVPASMPNTPNLNARSGRNAIVPEHEAQPQVSRGVAGSKIPPMSLNDAVPAIHHPLQRPKPPKRRVSQSVHPDIIARATVDTTIAIIPAQAFRRLIKIYPKATAHIVQVILSRFHRVTLAHAFNYLGLTGEVLQTEKNILKYTSCQLPNMLRGDALLRLKEKFKRERERMKDSQESKGIALHNSTINHQRRSSPTLRKEAAMHALSKQRTSSMSNNVGSPPERSSHHHKPQPGDLLANINQARNVHKPFGMDPKTPLALRSFNPFDSEKHARISVDPRDLAEEDDLFRTCILECIFKTLGLDNDGTISREPESTEASPRIGYMDQRRARAAFPSNAFGFMAPFETSIDGETESVTSSSMGLHGTPSAYILSQEMKNEMEIVFFPKGSILVQQGERSPGIYYVVDGFLDVGVSKESSREILHKSRPKTPETKSPDRPSSGGGHDDRSETQKHASRRRSVAWVKPGGIAGYIGGVSSYRSYIDVVAKTDVYVGFLPRSSLERIIDKYPIILLTMAKRLTSILPRLILHIDFALEWVQVNAGQVIFHNGDESEAIYVVLNGRLRLVEERKDGGVEAKAEYGQGESVGELEVLTESARSGTLHAIRDTEIVKFPRTLFNSLAQEHPNITIKISKIIAARMRAMVDDPMNLVGADAGSGAIRNHGKSTMNLRTVAILPITAGVPVVDFASQLMNALSQMGTPNGATSLNQAAILNHLGKHAFSKIGKLRLSQYLADLEEKYGLVVYVADTNVNSPWTQTCIAQADSILLVGLAVGSPEIGEYERFMLGMKSTAWKSLVLLHAERFSKPGLTRSWLRNRMWINGGHFHIQMAFTDNEVRVIPTSNKLGQTLKQQLQILQTEIQKYTTKRAQRYYIPDSPMKSDFHRLARRLCGKSIGLVLGGGGARGITHIGIIRAIEEAGIPIDIVGGTSIGAFVGALYARHADVVPMFGLAKKFAGRMASLWRFALDLTYPSASYTTGHEFNRGIFKAFGKTQIEDFWLEFYCNTTNITKSRNEFHTSGYAWRYIRASMSLAGLLPPLCDEGSMLLDGGYVDNLTVSHMRGLGVSSIFAIDVGAVDDDTPQTYGDSLSGMWAFFNRWNPFSSHPNPPTLAEIQARLAYVSSIDALESAKQIEGCIYMRPPIEAYGTLDFAKFDELYRLGYTYGQDFMKKLREQGKLPLSEEAEAKQSMRRTTARRRASI